MRRLTTLLLVIPFCFAAAQQVPVREKPFIENEMRRYKAQAERRQDAAAADSRYDVTYYGIDIAITTSPAYVQGSVLMKAVVADGGLSAFILDLMSSLTVDSVLVNDTLASVVPSATFVTVTPARAMEAGENFTAKIFYQGVPGSSGFGSFVFSSHNGTPWVWTLSEPYGAKDWWPCKDHQIDKADSLDVAVRCDAAFKVASNGILTGVTEHGDGTHTYEWKERYPISTYLVFVSITNFSEFTNWFHYGAGDSMPVLNYVLPEHLTSALAALPRTVDMLGIYSNLFGLYPFAAEKYGHNEFGWGGAMEHQTMTSTTTFNEYTVAHELAHQWFGDLITCRTWPDLWLNEGFATYCEALYAEQYYGQYWGAIGGDLANAKLATGTLYVQDTGSVGNLFAGSRVYSKGASVLHMLRHVVGDSAFFASMKNYAADPTLRYGTASTADFQRNVETTSGMDLDYFFTEWVFGERYPKYSFGWSAAPEAGGYHLTIHVAQSTGTANPLFFTMPVDFRITNGGWDTTVVLFNDSLIQTFDVMVSHAPVSVDLDPDGWIVKDIISTFAFSRSTIQYANPAVLYGSERTDSIQAVNSGAAPVTIFSASSSNPEFTVAPESAEVAPASSVTFYVTFHPVAAGQRTGTLLFTHSAPSSPSAVSLVGYCAVPMYSYPVQGGWNILSLPLSVPDPRKTTVFPGAATPAYTYDTLTHNYFTVDSLRPGVGYWLRYASPQMISVGGLPVVTDTIPVRAGWNLIGALSVAVPAVLVQSEPAGILLTPFYDYEGAYCLADSLQPAAGYWIKASAPGSLILSGSPSALSSRASDEEFLARCGVVAFRDAAAQVRRLYVAPPGEEELSRYTLPPPAPGGVFDVRFAAGTMVGGTSALGLSVAGAAYPLHIAVERPLPGVRLVLRAGGEEHDLQGAGVDVGAAAALSLVAGPDNDLPSSFSLFQNYPNPFNPRTVVGYGLPVRSTVRLEVFDLSGRLVGTIAEGSVAAGYHSAEWGGRSATGTELSSGVYLLRLTAVSAEGTRFTSSRKMLLMR